MLKAIIVGIIGALAFWGVSFAQTCPAYTYTLTNGTSADASQVMANFNTVRTCVNAVSQTALRGYISGLTLSTAGSSTTFGISSGVATDSTAFSSMNLPSAYTKATGSWAVGSGNGCLDTGAIANNTWYSEFLIQRTDTGVVDVLCSTSATAPTLPSPYTLFRRMGSMRTNGSAQWIAFTQNGDEFLWLAPPMDVSTTIGTTVTNYALSVPLGVVTNALMNAVGSGSGYFIAIYSPAQNAQSATVFNANVGWSPGVSYGTSQLSIRTNTSSQIAAVAQATSLSLWITTQGWIDTRGKNN